MLLAGGLVVLLALTVGGAVGLGRLSGPPEVDDVEIGPLPFGLPKALSVSPGGAYVLYNPESERGPPPRLCVLELDTGSSIGCADTPRTGPLEFQDVTWAPDEPVAVIARSPVLGEADGEDLHLLDPEMEQMQNLTDDPELGARTTGVYRSPSFSPDGSRVAAYWGESGSDAYELVTVDVDTEIVNVVVDGLEAPWPAPVWSADGERVWTNHINYPERAHWIRVVDLADGTSRRVELPETLETGGQDHFFRFWVMDVNDTGDKVLLQTVQTLRDEQVSATLPVYALLDVASGAVSLLEPFDPSAGPTDQPTVHAAALAPNGQRVLYIVRAAGVSGLNEPGPATRLEVRLADVEEVLAGESDPEVLVDDLGRRLDFDMMGVPVLLSDPSSSHAAGEQDLTWLFNVVHDRGTEHQRVEPMYARLELDRPF